MDAIEGDMALIPANGKPMLLAAILSLLTASVCVVIHLSVFLSTTKS
jgi:hypothetical protein